MEPKIPDLAIFGLEFENNILIFEISTLEFALLQNFEEKRKCLNVGRKMLYLGTFDQKMLYLGIFDQKCLIWVFLRKNFKNTIVMFEISTLKFV